MIFMACFSVLVVLLTVFMEAPDEETKDRHKWCDEYHPDLTFEECSREAGW